MTKRRKDTDYLFLSARIRAMERRLLTAQRLEQLLTAPSVEACAQLLSEWGYAPVHDEPSLQAALSAQREAVFADVSRFMPFFAACLPIMLGGWLSAIFQGRVAAASINIVAKHPEAATKGIIYCGIVEFYAILSLVATIMISLNIMK